MRIFSLTELAAARISSELESEADIKVIIERQLIPSHFKGSDFEVYLEVNEMLGLEREHSLGHTYSLLYSNIHCE